MLLKSSNLRVDSLDGQAGDGLQSNGSSVALEGAEEESSDQTVDITSCLGIGECLVSGSLLEAVGVCNVASSSGSGSGAKETEDGIRDLIWVVEVQDSSNCKIDISVSVLQGNLALGNATDGLTAQDASRSSSKEREGEKNCLLHVYKFRLIDVKSLIWERQVIV